MCREIHKSWMILPLNTSSGLIFGENEPFSLSLLKNLPGNP